MGLLNKVVGLFDRKTVGVRQIQPGRNDDCWCGSGIKYKKCHLEEDERKLRAAQKDSCGST